MQRLVLVLLVAGLCLSMLANAEKLEFHSFEPPFDEVDYGGDRMVSRNWRTAGSTVVNNNFARLTPDRQSKKGALWSRKELDTVSFSSIIKFRISGQGKNFYGDGIGLWIVQDPYYTEGNLHGYQENFVGVGIIFDTFKNTENIGAHRDVTVLINDGEKTYDMMIEDVQGCAMNMRYHSERADFTVKDSSRAKIEITPENGLIINIDARNTGEWTECVTIPNLPLPVEWTRAAHIGITASTGQLADNHDIISFMTYDNNQNLSLQEQAEASKKYFEFTPEDSDINIKLASVENAINNILEKLEYYDHYIEHEFAAVNDHVENLIGKLQKREEVSENRLENLEDIVRHEVEGTLNERLKNIEEQMKGTIDKKLNRVESDLNRKLNKKSDKEPPAKPEVKQTASKRNKAGRAQREQELEDEDEPPKRTNYLYWILIIFLSIGVMFGLYKLYDVMWKKKDTLPGYGSYGGYGPSKYQ